MITNEVYIKSISDKNYVLCKRKMYGHAYRYIYIHTEEIADDTFIVNTKLRFNLNDIEYRSIISEVKANRSTELTRKEKKKTLKLRVIEEIKTLKKSLKSKITRGKQKIRYVRREIFKSYQKTQRLENEVNNNVVFGTRKLLQDITRAANKGDKETYNSKLTEYQKNRIGNIYVLGEGNQKGNRFFDFDFKNNVITYKPNSKTKIIFDVIIPKNCKDDLYKLQELSLHKDIAISVRITENKLCFTYDNEKLNGYSLNTTKRKADIQQIKKLKLTNTLQTERIKTLYLEYYLDQKERRIKDKIQSRSISIDMNPNEIGYSIIDGDKILKSGVLDFKDLHVKSKKSSDSDESKYQTNKRIFEKHNAIKFLFKLAKHYKCSQFIMEDLSFKENVTTQNKNFNFQTKTIWNRNIIENAITKRCQNSGIELKKVNPMYSSFIGNVMNNIYDPIAASIEIGRRKIYYKGISFPIITDTIIDTVRCMLKDHATDVLLLKDCDVNSVGNNSSWKSLYNVSNKSRWRRAKEVGIQQSFSLFTKKSKVVHDMYTFT